MPVRQHAYGSTASIHCSRRNTSRLESSTARKDGRTKQTAARTASRQARTGGALDREHTAALRKRWRINGGTYHEHAENHLARSVAASRLRTVIQWTRIAGSGFPGACCGRRDHLVRLSDFGVDAVSLRHVSDFMYCPVIFECEEDAASCDCSYHENMREAEATHKDNDQPMCHECGFPATIRLIHWYCDTCYSSLNETHSED